MVDRALIAPPVEAAIPRPAAATAARRGRPAPPSVRRARRGGVIGLAIVALLIAAALLGPHFLGMEAQRQDLAGRLAPPLGFGGSAAHPLGTDALGRDLLARVVVGARVSLLVGVAATAAGGSVGVALGLVAGLGGGPVERFVAWLADVQQALPFVVVAIALGAVLGPGLDVVGLTLVLTGWVPYARIVRLQTLALRRAPWVEAARALGATPLRVGLRHLLPNLAGPVLVVAGHQVSAMILAEAALSYLGLGAGEATVTWGAMVAAGQEALFVAPWASVVPGAAVALTVLGFNLAGDWLASPATRR